MRMRDVFMIGECRGWAVDLSKMAERTVINVEAELLFWEREISADGFPGLEHSYHQLRPTLKFSYDAYLAWKGEALIELDSVLKCSYDRQIEPRKRLDWLYAERVVRVVWFRLGMAGAAWKSE